MSFSISVFQLLVFSGPTSGSERTFCPNNCSQSDQQREERLFLHGHLSVYVCVISTQSACGSRNSSTPHKQFWLKTRLALLMLDFDICSFVLAWAASFSCSLGSRVPALKPGFKRRRQRGTGLLSLRQPTVPALWQQRGMVLYMFRQIR